MHRFLFSVSLLAASATAWADDEAQVVSCVKTSVYDAYGDDWALRTLTTARLAGVDTKIWPVSLLGGLNYRFLACGGKGVVRMEIAVYDAQGTLIQRQTGEGADAAVDLQVERTSAYYVAARPAVVEAGGSEHWVGVGVLYK